MHETIIGLFSLQTSSRIFKIRLQKHNGNEQLPKRPNLNMTEIWIAISVPETWRKLDRIVKSWYYRFPQNVNVTETWSSMFPSRLRNAETWDFALWPVTNYRVPGTGRRASSLLFPKCDVKTKEVSTSQAWLAFVLMSQCANNDKLAPA